MVPVSWDGHACHPKHRGGFFGHRSLEVYLTETVIQMANSLVHFLNVILCNNNLILCHIMVYLCYYVILCYIDVILCYIICYIILHCIHMHSSNILHVRG